MEGTWYTWLPEKRHLVMFPPSDYTFLTFREAANCRGY